MKKHITLTGYGNIKLDNGLKLNVYIQIGEKKQEFV